MLVCIALVVVVVAGGQRCLFAWTFVECFVVLFCCLTELGSICWWSVVGAASSFHCSDHLVDHRLGDGKAFAHVLDVRVGSVSVLLRLDQFEYIITHQ